MTSKDPKELSSEVFIMRLTKREVGLLQSLAQAEHRSKAGYIKWLINEIADSLERAKENKKIEKKVNHAMAHQGPGRTVEETLPDGSKVIYKQWVDSEGTAFQEYSSEEELQKALKAEGFDLHDTLEFINPNGTKTLIPRKGLGHD